MLTLVPRGLRTRRGAMIFGLALSGLLIGGAIAVAVTGDNGGGPSAPSLDVPQSAVANDGALTFRLQNAAFSGTATFIQLLVTVPQEANPIVRVRVAPQAFGDHSLALAPGADGFTASPASPALVRLDAAPPTGGAELSFNSVQVVRVDGSTSTISGKWTLQLHTPSDLAARERTEFLIGSPAVDGTIKVSLQAAVRSTSETLVIVHVESAEAVSQLGQPTLLVDGRQFTGGSISTQEDRTLVTYSFPPTPFGSGVSLQFGPFVKAGADEAGSLTVDLGAVIARNSVAGTDRESATILDADSLEATGRMQHATALRFSTIFNSTQFPGRNWTATVTMPGALKGSGPSSFSVTGAKGQKLDVSGLGIGYSKDAGNVVSSPRTDVDFLIDSLDDIKGPVTITFDGQPEDTVRGDWTMALKPSR
jgi:hypothetical protein